MNNNSLKDKLFLIDGSSFLYRAYYGLQPLNSSSGETVQAVYGFCRMIKKLVDRFEIKRIVIVWDSKGKTERHEIFPEYKGTRKPAPQDLFQQKERILEFAELIGIEQLSVVGIEADDLIFSLAKKANAENIDAVIVSSDKDLRQAIDDQIFVLDPFKDQLLDAESCKERYGFDVKKLPFYFSILGDASDNIPGVRGIGKKGAEKLVAEFEGLTDLYENLDKIEKDRTKKLLIESKENAFLSEELFLLRKHEVATDLNDISFDEKDWANALPLFKLLEFKSFVRDIESDGGNVETIEMKKNLHEIYDFQLVNRKDQLLDLCEKIKSAGAFAFDTETTGLDPMSDKLVGFSICFKEGLAFYVPVAHKEKVQQQELFAELSSSSIDQLDFDFVINYIRPIFEDAAIKKYLHNAKFDQLVMLQAGIKMSGVSFDTMIVASLVMKEWEKKGLKNLSENLFNEEMLSYSDMVSKYKISDFSYVPIDEAVNYAAADAHQTFKLFKYFKPKLKELGIEKLFQDIEMPVSEILVEMQEVGIFCNDEILNQLGVKINKLLLDIEKKITDLVGSSINLNSPLQVKKLLFDDLGLEPQRKSKKTKSFSTDAHVLKSLAKEHVVPGLILTYREIYKLKSTYIEALHNFINEKTGRIHSSWNQTFVATGRLSSSNPNLQNIPKAIRFDGIDVRGAFLPKEGNVFISADYSQVELRVLAQLSGDEGLRDAFLNDADIHAKTAAKIFKIEEGDVSSDQRSVGKRINFSVLYGMTPYGLSRDMEVSYADAKSYIEGYFEGYPGVSKWMEQQVEFAKQNGYVKTLFGRRRYVPGIHERNKTLFELAQRIAINSPVQGTASEIIKLGMIKFHDEIKKSGLDAEILLQIHDELLVSCPISQRSEVEKILKMSLESVVTWDIPLIVSVKSGKDWRAVTG